MRERAPLLSLSNGGTELVNTRGTERTYATEGRSFSLTSKKNQPLPSLPSDDDDDSGGGRCRLLLRRGFFFFDQLGARPQARGPSEGVPQGGQGERAARAPLLVQEPGTRVFFLRETVFWGREREREREKNKGFFYSHFSLLSLLPLNPPHHHHHHQVYAIEARSPAEGAYSEGFADAKLTQDFCIECPTTKTLFSLKTGEVVAWYPTNPILRALTPRDTCRALDIFPVRLTQEAISVDAAGGSASAGAVPSTRGGADSSIDRNNVYAISPKTYTSDDDFYAPTKAAPSGGGASASDSIGATAATITSVIAVVATGAAGTAVAVYKDLGAFAIVAVWVAVGAATFAYSRSGKE